MRETIISAVILAAGLSTRFPGNKMLKPLKLGGVEVPLIKHTVMKFISSRLFDEVVVVLGHDAAEILKATAMHGIKYVFSIHYREGMSYSVKAGVSSVMKYSDIIAIHPGDVPFILPETLRRLTEVAVQDLHNVKESIVIPKYVPLSKGGHPLLITKPLIPYVTEISEEGKGLKGFLSRFRTRIHYVPTHDLGVLADIDTPEDLSRDRELMERESLQ